MSRYQVGDVFHIKAIITDFDADDEEQSYHLEFDSELQEFLPDGRLHYDDLSIGWFSEDDLDMMFNSARRTEMAKNRIKEYETQISRIHKEIQKLEDSL